MHIRSRAAAAATTLVLLAAPLAACGSDEKDVDAEPSSETSATTGTDDSSSEDGSEGGSEDGALTKENFAAEVIAAAEEGKSAHMSMSMGEDLQMEGDIVYQGKSTAMSMTMGMGEQQGKMILIDQTMYMQMPGMSQPGKWTKVDKDTPGLGQLFDQMGSFDPSASIKAMDEGLKDLEYAGEESVDGEDLHLYKLTVDTTKMTRGMGMASSNGPGDVTYDLYLDDENRMRRTVMEVAGRTIQIDISDWGKDVDVQAPPASDIVEVPGQ